jgi:TPR repeat protein
MGFLCKNYNFGQSGKEDTLIVHDNQSSKYTISVALVVLCILLVSCTGMREAAVLSALNGGRFQKAVSYMRGLPLSKRKETLRVWCKDSALMATTKQDSQAMVNLAYCYETGLGGFPQEEQKAAEWYKKAADVGDKEGIQGLERLGVRAPN